MKFTVEILLSDGRVITLEILAASHDAAEELALEEAQAYQRTHPIATQSIAA